MQTSLDAQIAAWIGRVGAAGAEHVQHRFALNRTRCYRRLHALTTAGLVRNERLLYGRPGLYVATREGLRWQHLQRLGVFRLSPGGFAHGSQVAGLVAVLEPALPAHRLLTDRELRAIEQDTRELIASVRVGETAGRPLIHRPDMALVGPTGSVLAVEVELSVKAHRRLVQITRGYARARNIDHTLYLAGERVGRAVTQAIRDVRAEDRITVVRLDDVEAMVEAVRSWS